MLDFTSYLNETIVWCGTSNCKHSKQVVRVPLKKEATALHKSTKQYTKLSNKKDNPTRTLTDHYHICHRNEA